MSVPATTLFHIEKLRRYDGPGWFLGGGFVLGLLLFSIWLHGRPDDGRRDLRARGNGVVGMQAPEDDRGVLGDITGELRAGAASGAGLRDGDFFFSEAEPEDEDATDEEGALAPDPGFDSTYVQDADSMAVGENVGESPTPEGALTDSLLGPPPEAAAPIAPSAEMPPSAPGEDLRPWFVEVEVAPGVVQMLQLNAESPEHAMAILRDFRGNPRVLRGPSPEPLP